MRIESRPSPNHNARPHGLRPDCLILHSDASPSTAATLSWLASERSKVSYHYICGRLGHVYQCVAVDRRAWHAGRSSLAGREDCNDYSIGVAFSNLNDGVQPYPEEQLEAGAELCAHLAYKFSIPRERIVRHRDVSPGRKSDPMPPAFDYDAFLVRVDRHLAEVQA